MDPGPLPGMPRTGQETPQNGHPNHLTPARPVSAARRATSVPERAGNCGHQRSPMGTANDRRLGHAQVDPKPETTF